MNIRIVIYREDPANSAYRETIMEISKPEEMVHLNDLVSNVVKSVDVTHKEESLPLEEV